MSFQVYEQGRRIETPWYALFPSRQVSPLEKSAKSKKVALHRDDSEEQQLAPEPSVSQTAAVSTDETSAALELYEQSQNPSGDQANALQFVWQVMTPDVLTLSRRATLAEAWTLLSSTGVRHLPVVAEGSQRLEGLLSERDVLLALSPLSGSAISIQTPVESIMRHRVLTATEDTLLRELTSVMLERHIGCMPVVEFGESLELKGLVTRSDVLRAISHQVPLELWA